VRVGFDALRALRNDTGLGNYSRGVLSGLRLAAPDLAMLLYSPRGASHDHRDLGRELGATVRLPDLHLGTGLPRALWRTFRIGHAARHDRIDLYHGLSHEIPRDLPRSGVPSIVTFHDLLFEQHPELFPPMDRWSYRWRYRWSAQHADVIVAVSRHTRRALMQYYGVDGNRVVVIPPARHGRFLHGGDESRRAAVRTKYLLPDRYLLSVGTLERRKNHRVLIEAIAADATGQLPALVMVGRNGGSARDLQARVRRAGLESRVRFLHDVADPDLAALVASASAFLYPSLAEGFGMPIVEAMSAGVPVIAAEGEHLRDAGGEAARYVDPREPAAWTTAISEVLESAVVASRMIEAGRRHASRFDAVDLGCRLLAVYSAVLCGSPLPAEAATPATVGTG
jgi:glycosyltransferase involved in cell wall biosynthesis